MATKFKGNHEGLCLVVGIALGALLTSVDRLDFQGTITLGQLFQGLLILGMFLLGHHSYTRIHDRRSRKLNVLFDVVSDVLEKSEQMHKCFWDCLEAEGKLSNAKRRRFDASLSNYDYSLHELETIVEIHGDLSHVDDMESLVEDRHKYRDYVTDSPYPEQMSHQKAEQESTLHMDLRSNLRRFQFKLSNPRLFITQT